jgi:hypothetical protein
MLLRVAFHELSRRRGQLGSMSGPEFDDLAQQAANDALMKVLAKLDEFRGLDPSRPAPRDPLAADALRRRHVARRYR